MQKGPRGRRKCRLGNCCAPTRKSRLCSSSLRAAGRTHHLPFRITEANSVYNEGQRGVSDTLGAALWGLELMFQLAAAGAAGVNFHAGVHNLRAGEDKAYTPIARSGGGYRAAALY